MLALVAVVGILARVAFVLGFTRDLHLGLDSRWYEPTSGIIVDGHCLADPAAFFQRQRVVPTAFRVPRYSTFLAGVTEVFGAMRTTFWGVSLVTLGFALLDRRRVRRAAAAPSVALGQTE